MSITDTIWQVSKWASQQRALCHGLLETPPSQNGGDVEKCWGGYVWRYIFVGWLHEICEIVAIWKEVVWFPGYEKETRKKKQSIKTSTLCVFLKDSHLKCSNFFSNDSKTIILSRSLFPQSSQSSRNLRTIMFRHSSCWNRRTNLLLNRGVDMHTIRQQNAWISEPLVPTKLGDFGSPFRGSEGEITIWKIRHYFVLDPNSDK